MSRRLETAALCLCSPSLFLAAVQRGKIIIDRPQNTFSSPAYQVRLVSILLLLPRFYRLLFFLRLAIIDLQPPCAREQKESVRSGVPKQSIPHHPAEPHTHQSIPPAPSLQMHKQGTSSKAAPQRAPIMSRKTHGDGRGRQKKKKFYSRIKFSNQISTALIIPNQPHVCIMYQNLGEKSN